MKQQIINQLRNSLHVILSIPIMYTISHLGDGNEWIGKYASVTALAIVLGLITGCVGEGFQQWAFGKKKDGKNTFSWTDVALTVFGFILGGLLQICYPDLNWMDRYLTPLALACIVFEVIRVLRIKYRNI